MPKGLTREPDYTYIACWAVTILAILGALVWAWS